MAQDKERPVKILIINVHSAQNKGDAALLTMAVKCLRDAFPTSSFTIAANDLDSLTIAESKVGSFFYWMHRVSPEGKIQWYPAGIMKVLIVSLWALVTYRLLGCPFFLGMSHALKDTINAYFEADLVVSAPGNFLYSSGKFGFTFLVTAYTMGYALLSGKPLYLLPQSIGPLRRNRDRKLIRWILNRARIVMIREPLSMDELLNVGVSNPRCYLKPDLAFALQSAPIQEATARLRTWGVESDYDRPLLGITVINWGARTGREDLQIRYEDALIKAVTYFLDNFGGKALFFPQVRSKAFANDDLQVARRITSQLSKEHYVLLIEEDLSPELLKAIYGLMDIFVGTRMHSNIFALSQGVPVIAIAYFPKTWGIMQMLGLEKWVLDIDKITSESLLSRMVELYQEREHISQYIKAQLGQLIQECSQVGLYIASDFALLEGKANETAK
ncbi:MAG: polysaccharide pyruvyl transferase family protein [Candidatus Bathyarchaeia archaeon]